MLNPVLLFLMHSFDLIFNCYSSGIQNQLKMFSIKDGTLKEQMEFFRKRAQALETEIRSVL
jgi:hypothetical protein